MTSPVSRPASALPCLADGGDANDLSRRDFVHVAGCSALLALIAACGGGGEATGPGNGGGGGGNGGGGNAITALARINNATVSGQTWTIPIAGTALATAGGIALVPNADLIVINTGNNTFRAFTSICTHQGATIDARIGDNLRCPLHGSQFSISSGTPVVGPSGDSPGSIGALRSFTATFNATSNAVVVNRA